MILDTEPNVFNFTVAVIDFYAIIIFKLFRIYHDSKINTHQFFKNEIADILQPRRCNMGEDQYHFAKVVDPQPETLSNLTGRVDHLIFYTSPSTSG